MWVERLCSGVLHLWCRCHLLFYLIPYAADNRSLSVSVSVESEQDYATLNVLHVRLRELFGFKLEKPEAEIIPPLPPPSFHFLLVLLFLLMFPFIQHILSCILFLLLLFIFCFMLPFYPFFLLM
jgi:hypothetical protein